MKQILLLSILLMMVGCTPNIIEYDSEKMEAEQISHIKDAQLKDPFKYEQSPSHVTVIHQDDIYIEVHKVKPLVGPSGILLETWVATATNMGYDSKCVMVGWQLQDFDFESNLPMEFLLFGGETLEIGKMRQTIWAFDNVYLALPPSGYANKLWIRDADVDEQTGAESCEPDESNIDVL